MNAFLYVYFDPVQSIVDVDIALNVTSNVSLSLRPTGIQVTVTNTWSNSLNIDNVASWIASAFPLKPYSNVSTPQVNSETGGAGLPFKTDSKLINQTISAHVTQIGLRVDMHYEYFTLSHYAYNFSGANIGEDTLHFTASLQGLGKPVYAKINVLLMNSG